jgi:hypothetical protein
MPSVSVVVKGRENSCRVDGKKIERQKARGFLYEDFVKADKSIAKIAFSDCLVRKGRTYRFIPGTPQSRGVYMRFGKKGDE